jgi:cell division protein FtsB
MDLISHCIKRNQRVLEGRATAGTLIILLVLSLLGWLYLTQASYVATASRRVQDLEQKEAQLQRENMELMAEIAQLDSVSRLAVRAKELGFVKVVPEEADFVLVGALPEIPEVALADSSPMTRWLSSVSAQFTAWVRTEGQ